MNLSYPSSHTQNFFFTLDILYRHFLITLVVIDESSPGKKIKGVCRAGHTGGCMGFTSKSLDSLIPGSSKNTPGLIAESVALYAAIFAFWAFFRSLFLA